MSLPFSKFHTGKLIAAPSEARLLELWEAFGTEAQYVKLRAAIGSQRYNTAIIFMPPYRGDLEEGLSLGRWINESVRTRLMPGGKLLVI